MILVFWKLSFKPTFSHFPFTFIKRLFSSLLSAVSVVSSPYLRLLIFLLSMLVPACASSSSSWICDLFLLLWLVSGCFCFWFFIRFICVCLFVCWGFPGGAVVRNLPANAGDAGDSSLIPGSGRSPKVGNGNPLQCSCIENSMDRGTWLATVHGIAKSWTWLNTHTGIHNTKPTNLFGK